MAFGLCILSPVCVSDGTPKNTPWEMPMLLNSGTNRQGAAWCHAPLHPTPLITHSFICFRLLFLGSWPLDVPTEHYSAMGEAAKPSCHLTEALQPPWARARMKHRPCPWQGSVSLGTEGRVLSPPPCVCHGRLQRLSACGQGDSRWACGCDFREGAFSGGGEIPLCSHQLWIDDAGVGSQRRDISEPWDFHDEIPDLIS